jgi:hypothetical protein
MGQASSARVRFLVSQEDKRRWSTALLIVSYLIVVMQVLRIA